MAAIDTLEKEVATIHKSMDSVEQGLLGKEMPRSDDTAPRMSFTETVQNAVNSYVPWRSRLMFAALIVGLLCGVIACLYEIVMDFVLEMVWTEGGEKFAELFPTVPKYLFIPLICITFGGFTGVLIRVLGEPMANLPGVVLATHRDGLLGHEEAPAMGAISISSIVAGGSLGPEAPLVSIGGGLASLVAQFIDLSEAETLFVTMCGMGAGLAAFFGEPVGGALFACEVIHRYGLEYYEAVVPTVIAGLACNWSFRVLANLPQEPIWTFPPEDRLLPWSSILGLAYGVIGGFLGWAWMRGTNWTRENVLVRFKLGPRHIVKGLIGGTIIGGIGMCLPETLFWAEYEAQSIIDHGATKLPHVNPSVGILGEYSLSDPIYLFAIGIAKLVAISVTVLAGYRGGFIFPFMFAGHSIGTGLSIALAGIVPLSPAAAALSCACAINVAVTRTVLATPIVLATISGRTDCFPTLLVASIVSLYMTGNESIIKAARKRYLRAELEGTEDMKDGATPRLERNRIVVQNRSNRTTPNSSKHGGTAFGPGGISIGSTPPTGAALASAVALKLEDKDKAVSA